MSNETKARFAKAENLIAAIAEAALHANMSPVEMLARFTEASWDEIGKATGYKINHTDPQTKELVMWHFGVIESSRKQIAKVDLPLVFKRTA